MKQITSLRIHYSLVLSLGLTPGLMAGSTIASLTADSGSVTANAQRIEIAHQDGKTKHRHCHKRFRRADYVLECHNHEHGARHLHERG